MLQNPHAAWAYINAADSVARAAGVQAGTNVASGTANNYGSWVQIHAGLTYHTDCVLVGITAVETSADVVAATTRNAYIDIGVGTDSSNVTVVIEKLCGSHANQLGRFYWIPIRLPPDQILWARHQNTQASAKAGVALTVFGGNGNPATFPACTRVVCIGATTASTTGTAITPGASSAEGAWTQIVASSAADYSGVMIGGLFTVDTTMTSGLATVMDVAVGGAGVERSIGENLTSQLVYSANEEVVSFSVPSMVHVPAGQRLSARASGSGTADSTNSIVLYGLVR